jgi:hypothetical protein
MPIMLLRKHRKEDQGSRFKACHEQKREALLEKVTQSKKSRTVA